MKEQQATKMLRRIVPTAPGKIKIYDENSSSVEPCVQNCERRENKDNVKIDMVKTCEIRGEVVAVASTSTTVTATQCSLCTCHVKVITDESGSQTEASRQTTSGTQTTAECHTQKTAEEEALELMGQGKDVFVMWSFCHLDGYRSADVSSLVRENGPIIIYLCCYLP